MTKTWNHWHPFTTWKRWKSEQSLSQIFPKIIFKFKLHIFHWRRGRASFFATKRSRAFGRCASDFVSKDPRSDWWFERQPSLLHVFHQVVCVCRSCGFALDDDTLLLMYDIVVDNPRELQLVGSSTIGVKDHLVLDKCLAAMDAQSLGVMGPGPGALFAVSYHFQPWSAPPFTS